MASFTFFDNFTTAQTLATGEFGFIADTGSLVVDDDAITADGDVAVSGLRPAVRRLQRRGPRGRCVRAHRRSERARRGEKTAMRS